MNPDQLKTAIDVLINTLKCLPADQQSSILGALQPDVASEIGRLLKNSRIHIPAAGDASNYVADDGCQTDQEGLEHSSEELTLTKRIETSFTFDSADNATLPLNIDRYAIRKELGSGGFGVVYLAFDNELERLVALKTPHRKLIRDDNDVDTFLAEARVLARLDHPGIVPVYDAGRTEDGRCYLVSKFIDGIDLAELMRKGNQSHGQSINLVARVARALHYAHTTGIVHRDVKPGNILIDTNGVPHLADFGLALHYECMSQGGERAGTPAYMSPEQAIGKSGSVDGRSDIFSLGVVLYRLLTGQFPFRGSNWEELVEQITHLEPRPLRQIDDTIPKKLEAICLKCLSKNVRDRYTTALDLWEDLTAIATYEPLPIDVSRVALPDSLNDLVEMLSLNNHDVWAQQRIMEGWQFGDVRDDQRKTHPDLVPYEQLTESEKEYDRRTVVMTVKAILASGYTILHTR